LPQPQAVAWGRAVLVARRRRMGTPQRRPARSCACHRRRRAGDLRGSRAGGRGGNRGPKRDAAHRRFPARSRRLGPIAGGPARSSGEAYVNHSVAVAGSLAEMRLDAVTVAAALLHDVPEDTPRTMEEIRAKFGPEVAGLVDGVTKLGRIEWKSREERQAENLRKMFLAMANDIRIILIKLADRVHNLRTIEYLPEWKQKRTASETLEIYAPLTERLGIGSIKRELEDRAFAVLEPDASREISGQIERSRQEQEALLARVVETLHRELNQGGIRVDAGQITGRPKHVYSIYQKMQRPKYQGQGVGRIYDRLAIRVIVNDLRECYEALGVAHSLWKPIPGEVDDYIANPKTSGYQSLHTAVICEGQPL